MVDWVGSVGSGDWKAGGLNPTQCCYVANMKAKKKKKLNSCFTG